MKKQVSALLAAGMAASLLVGCGGGAASSSAAPASTAESTTSEAAPAESTDDAAGQAADITLWTYPIGKWGDSDSVNELLADFNAQYPDIHVTVEYLDYTNGDDQVNTAIEGGSAPDLVMEGPERLVANWGAKGLMADLSDLWTDEQKADISASVEAACKSSDGAYYEYPLCMTAHCMAINKTVFEAADAMQYVDEDTHTWTTENFLKAVQAVYDSGKTDVGAIYCSGQGGDQGTRAIINNMYGGTFTDAAHTKYTADSAENIKAIQALYDQDGINFDASINGGEEITLFRNGTLQMAFCWNIAQQTNSDNGPAGTTNNGDDILFMAFPTDSGDPQLCGGIWGFGIFDNGDDNKIAASKTFIDFMANSDETAKAVKTSTYFSVKNSLSDLYADDAIMSEYQKLMPYLGDYYQVVPGWAEARTAWWNMLQQVGSGADVTTAVNEFCTTANAAASAS
ncbi:extracellular solute-binding protein [Gemmiger sp.]|uniref:extracellular solute-binding protein n=1 Tax=Gemmiger sp. TaxID=2049027 RepID=UPI0025ECF959|nr:extracellular solute-binding protein [uncultured Gemmiger sp.]